MVSVRHTRADVVAAAGRLFAERGYHGTSMRDLGGELGMLGSSLYAHVESKQDLLVEVVQEGARLFEASAVDAVAGGGAATDRLRRLISGHVGVVLDNLDVARTFLNEARMLDDDHRSTVLDARDQYEAVFRTVVHDGLREASFRSDVDPKTASIFILSILNAIERWYSPKGRLKRDDLVAQLTEFVVNALT